MKGILLLLALWTATGVFAQKKKDAALPYFPTAHQWEQRPAQSMGFDTSKLNEAVRFAIAQEAKAPRSMELAQAMTFGREPFGEGIGPFSNRGEPTGLIIRSGYLVASWGEPDRVDMTHSVTKSFLSTVVGLAYDAGLIRDVQDRVAPYLPPIELYQPEKISSPAEEFGRGQLLRPFSGAHNEQITWDALLRQTSDWEGTLWGKPDWADRPDAQAANWLNRKRNAPGTVWEYNDVRVNVLALAATSLWRKPLPQVLKEKVMDPIGASATWRWTGYRNAWIVLDGQPVQSVSGGGHWGGGMFINAYDMARFGLLTLNRGNWNGKRIVSEAWIRQALTPTRVQPTYGYMNFYLNTEKQYVPAAPASAFLHLGNGTNMIYVDPENDLVIVARWIETKGMNEFIQKVLAAASSTRKAKQ